MAKNILSKISLIAVLSIAWSMVLPFYFNGGSTLTCGITTGCKGYEMTRVSTGAWHWFGGYHIFIQQFLSADQLHRKTYASTYHYSSDLLVFVLLIASVILVVSTYFTGRRLLSSKSSHKSSVATET